MKIYYIPQHLIEEEQSQDIESAVQNWKHMTNLERKSFINSIGVHTNPIWKELRYGKFTASTAAEFLAESRSKDDVLGDSAKTLCHRVMAELTGWRAEENPYMEYASIRRGLIFEPIARKLAEKELGTTIEECGFVECSPMYGCSPDGLIMKDGKIDAVVEIKCPEPMAFYKQLMNCAKREYQLQMQFAMNICDCPRAYFVLYCPEVSDKVYILKYTRGMMWQKKIEQRKLDIGNYISKVEQQIKQGEFNIETLE